jgi:hypothetical protein
MADKNTRRGSRMPSNMNYHLEVTKGFAELHPDHVERLSKHQLIYSVAGLVLGLICILGGIFLFINGVTGFTSWTAKMFGAESKITEAAPGAVLFIVGVFVVLLTRYVMKVKH